jgi:Holliday junction resolvasome RuvABC endonuclease subunit
LNEGHSLRIVGLDLSLTSTGVACINGPGDRSEATWTIKSRHKGMQRLCEIRNYVRPVSMPADLVLIEGYSYNSRNGGERLGELGGVIRVDLWEAGIPYVEIEPARLKKYATGKGNASKDAVFGAAVHRAGREFATNDEADAWWLLQMALAHYDLAHIRMPKTSWDVLDLIEWPALREVAPS